MNTKYKFDLALQCALSVHFYNMNTLFSFVDDVLI